jgi:hypothetical protein
MKKTIVTCLISSVLFTACSKTNSDVSAVSLTASSTEASVGQTISVTATTSTNAVSWSVSPATSVQKTYNVTTEKTNYFTFSQPGEYLIGIRAANILLDSVHVCHPADSLDHHLEDSAWNRQVDSIWHHEGHHKGGCRNGVDSASIQITVK